MNSTDWLNTDASAQESASSSDSDSRLIFREERGSNLAPFFYAEQPGRQKPCSVFCTSVKNKKEMPKLRQATVSN